MPERIVGKVVAYTEAGNLVTDITSQQLDNAPRDERVSIRCDEHETNGIFSKDHSEPDFTLIALFGDKDHLELEIVGDSAKIMLGVSLGEQVTIAW